MKDVLMGKQFKNQGELERYLIQQHHPMIVREVVWAGESRSHIGLGGVHIKTNVNIP